MAQRDDRERADVPPAENEIPRRGRGSSPPAGGPPVGYAPGMAAPDEAGTGAVQAVASALADAVPAAQVQVAPGGIVAAAHPNGQAVQVAMVAGEDGSPRFQVAVPGVPAELGGLVTPSLDLAVDKARQILGADIGDTEPGMGEGI